LRVVTSRTNRARTRARWHQTATTIRQLLRSLAQRCHHAGLGKRAGTAGSIGTGENVMDSPLAPNWLKPPADTAGVDPKIFTSGVARDNAQLTVQGIGVSELVEQF